MRKITVIHAHVGTTMMTTDTVLTMITVISTGPKRLSPVWRLQLAL